MLYIGVHAIYGIVFVSFDEGIASTVLPKHNFIS